MVPPLVVAVVAAAAAPPVPPFAAGGAAAAAGLEEGKTLSDIVKTKKKKQKKKVRLGRVLGRQRESQGVRFVKGERVNLRRRIVDKGELLSTQRGWCHLTRFGISFFFLYDCKNFLFSNFNVKCFCL